MHSALVRGQNVFGYFTTVASVVAAVIALSVLIAPQNPKATLTLRNVQVAKGRPHYYSVKREEYAHVRFDLDTDISSLFNWNTKQVFLWVKAVYPSSSPGEPASEAIVWDAILPAPLAPWHQNQYIHPSPPPTPKAPKKQTTKQRLAAAANKKQATGPYYTNMRLPGIIKLSNQKPKYQITDHTGLIANRGNATLEMGWNIQPWVGALVWTNFETIMAWKGLEGGRTKAFTFPEIKGTKPAGMDTVKGGEHNRGKPA